MRDSNAGTWIGFHVTPSENAASILAEGFREGDCPFFTMSGDVRPLRGVYFWGSPDPIATGLLGLRRKWAACPLTLFVVRLPAALSARYEISDSPADPWREWCIPARVVNSYSVDAWPVSVPDPTAADSAIFGHWRRVAEKQLRQKYNLPPLGH
jgi:hypothetical protein